MKQHSIEDLLDNLESNDVPAPTDDARAQAIAKANQTFDQAFAQAARPKTKSTDSYLRSFIMSVFSKQPLKPSFRYAFGVLAVIGIATPILVSYNSGPVSNTLPAPELNKTSEQASQAEIQDNFGDDLASSIEAEPVEEALVSGSRVASQRKAENQILTPTTTAPVPQRAASRPNAAPVADMALRREIHILPETEKEFRIVTKPVGDELGGSISVRPDLDEEYAEYQRNSIKQVLEHPISTFSADVDTASYSLVRNQINRGFLPAQQAVRPEEFINYFNYDYPLPESKAQPFKPSISIMDSPWNEGRKLVHIGIRGYDIQPTSMPDSNIVFLVDVSGSMSNVNKLPLAKRSISFLLKQLKPTDKVSIAVYAGAAGVVLEPTPVKEKSKIIDALGKLNAGGSTAGGAGIQLAYNLAEQHFDKDAINRIVLLTDGDFNVGQSSNQALLELVERKREGGVFLSVLGFGRNNYQDDMMQTLAQNGNGIATYIDTLSEAKKVMVDEATSSLFPIAKDVKFQVEFNPMTVSDYRLVGYETRALATEDFNNDKVDAGDIGAGHTVTAIYEITPSGSKAQSVDTPRYSANQKPKIATGSTSEYGFLKMRYKLPSDTKSKLIETPINIESSEPSQDAKFSIAVAGFAQILSGNKNIGDWGLKDTVKMAKANKGNDAYGYRAEFIQLVEMATWVD